MTKTGVNNLSQQLCELCRVKPIFLSNCSFENEVRLGRSEGIDICKYENGECSCSECELGTTYTALFPDFEKPENFVKLFNLITHIEDFSFVTGQTYISCIPIYRFSSYLTTESNQYESYSNDVVKAFLECLIEHVKEDKDTAEYIASEEWEY